MAEVSPLERRQPATAAELLHLAVAAEALLLLRLAAAAKALAVSRLVGLPRHALRRGSRQPQPFGMPPRPYLLLSRLAFGGFLRRARASASAIWRAAAASALAFSASRPGGPLPGAPRPCGCKLLLGSFPLSFLGQSFFLGSFPRGCLSLGILPGG
jgi:hypothetical protein